MAQRNGWPGKLNFGGVDFVPGQRLVVDEDGVVVLPPGLKETALPVEDALVATAHCDGTGKTAAPQTNP
jgi:regulator of ribonuclease activity A